MPALPLLRLTAAATLSPALGTVRLGHRQAGAPSVLDQYSGTRVVCQRSAPRATPRATQNGEAEAATHGI